MEQQLCRSHWRRRAPTTVIELGLNSVEQGSIQNGRLFARKDLAFIDDLADVEPVTQ
jgi:hypothetical protein